MGNNEYCEVKNIKQKLFIVKRDLMIQQILKEHHINVGYRISFNAIMTLSQLRFHHGKKIVSSFDDPVIKNLYNMGLIIKTKEYLDLTRDVDVIKLTPLGKRYCQYVLPQRDPQWISDDEEFQLEMYMMANDQASHGQSKVLPIMIIIGILIGVRIWLQIIPTSTEPFSTALDMLIAITIAISSGVYISQQNYKKSEYSKLSDNCIPILHEMESMFAPPHILVEDANEEKYEEVILKTHSTRYTFLMLLIETNQLSNVLANDKDLEIFKHWMFNNQ